MLSFLPSLPSSFRYPHLQVSSEPDVPSYLADEVLSHFFIQLGSKRFYICYVYGGMCYSSLSDIFHWYCYCPTTRYLFLSLKHDPVCFYTFSTLTSSWFFLLGSSIVSFFNIVMMYYLTSNSLRSQNVVESIFFHVLSFAYFSFDLFFFSHILFCLNSTSTILGLFPCLASLLHSSIITVVIFLPYHLQLFFQDGLSVSSSILQGNIKKWKTNHNKSRNSSVLVHEDHIN